MFDARKIFSDLQTQASQIVKNAEVDQRIDQAKSAAGKIRERFETDATARSVAAGAGGLLLLGLLSSRGGRKFVGRLASSGAVAALGAVAYKAWSDRIGRKATDDPAPEELAAAGYHVEIEPDAEFAESLVHAMLGAAYADGVLDERERVTIEAALDRAGTSAEERGLLMNDMPEADRMARIVKGAKTPTHAAEAFAAAAAIAGDRAGPETGFLKRLADKLAIHPDHASAIIKAAS